MPVMVPVMVPEPELVPGPVLVLGLGPVLGPVLVPGSAQRSRREPYQLSKEPLMLKRISSSLLLLLYRIV